MEAASNSPSVRQAIAIGAAEVDRGGPGLVLPWLLLWLGWRPRSTLATPLASPTIAAMEQAERGRRDLAPDDEAITAVTRRLFHLSAPCRYHDATRGRNGHPFHAHERPSRRSDGAAHELRFEPARVQPRTLLETSQLATDEPSLVRCAGECRSRSRRKPKMSEARTTRIRHTRYRRRNLLPDHWLSHQPPTAIATMPTTLAAAG